MKLSKFLSAFLIIVGTAFVGYAVYEIVYTKVETQQSLVEAKEVIKKSQSKKGALSEPFDPIMGEAVGILTIPKLDAELPIVEGTDPDDLEKGVGHYKGSFYPNDGGQIVLSGHRDTVFRNVGKLKLGDSLVMSLPYGDFTYKIIETKIVEADDTSIITLQKDFEELILTTCYPFSYVGDAPQRYIIYAEKQD
ncbi:class D sortase [Bacillus timonensis]|nr:class D sortase [Bacillus timonensis]